MIFSYSLRVVSLICFWFNDIFADAWYDHFFFVSRLLRSLACGSQKKKKRNGMLCFCTLSTGMPYIHGALSWTHATCTISTVKRETCYIEVLICVGCDFWWKLYLTFNNHFWDSTFFEPLHFEDVGLNYRIKIIFFWIIESKLFFSEYSRMTHKIKNIVFPKKSKSFQFLRTELHGTVKEKNCEHP